jgi:hypothetical protein
MLKKIHVCQIPVLFVKTPVAPSHLLSKWPRWKSRFTDWNHPISAGELFIPFSTTTPSPRWRIFAVQWTRKTFVYNLLGYLLAVVVVLILYAFVRKHVKKTPSAHSNSGFRIRIFFFIYSHRFGRLHATDFWHAKRQFLLLQWQSF